jgi:4'-phosphopantetheinyl transferase
MRIWLAPTRSLDSDALLRAAGPWVTLAERERAARLRQPQARVDRLAGRAILRRRLAEALDLGPERLLLAPDIAGRPRCPAAEARGLHFSLAHGGGIVAVALAWGAAIGVDVETMHRAAPHLAEADWLTPAEAAACAALPAALRPRRRLDLWVLKESYAKALGLGLSLPFQDFGFDLAGRAPRLDDVSLPPCAAWLGEADPGQPLAVCQLWPRAETSVVEVLRCDLSSILDQGGSPEGAFRRRSVRGLAGEPQSAPANPKDGQRVERPGWGMPPPPRFAWSPSPASGRERRASSRSRQNHPWRAGLIPC